MEVDCVRRFYSGTVQATKSFCFSVVWDYEFIFGGRSSSSYGIRLKVEFVYRDCKLPIYYLDKKLSLQSFLLSSRVGSCESRSIDLTLEVSQKSDMIQ